MLQIFLTRPRFHEAGGGAGNKLHEGANDEVVELGEGVAHGGSRVLVGQAHWEAGVKFRHLSHERHKVT